MSGKFLLKFIFQQVFYGGTVESQIHQLNAWKEAGQVVFLKFRKKLAESELIITDG